MDRIVKAESAAMGVTIASLLSEMIEPTPHRRGRWRPPVPLIEESASEWVEPDRRRGKMDD